MPPPNRTHTAAAAMQRRSGFVVKGGRHTTRACAGQAVGQWDWRCQYILFPANAGGGGGGVAVKLRYISFWSRDWMPAMSSGGAQGFLQNGFFDQLCTQLVGW